MFVLNLNPHPATFNLQEKKAEKLAEKQARDDAALAAKEKARSFPIPRPPVGTYSTVGHL